MQHSAISVHGSSLPHLYSTPECFPSQMSLERTTRPSLQSGHLLAAVTAHAGIQTVGYHFLGSCLRVVQRTPIRHRRVP
jgi:hypothetical protein